jgi:hypothetical protein
MTAKWRGEMAIYDFASYRTLTIFMSEIWVESVVMVSNNRRRNSFFFHNINPYEKCLPLLNEEGRVVVFI